MKKSFFRPTKWQLVLVLVAPLIIAAGPDPSSSTTESQGLSLSSPLRGFAPTINPAAITQLKGYSMGGSYSMDNLSQGTFSGTGGDFGLGAVYYSDAKLRDQEIDVGLAYSLGSVTAGASYVNLERADFGLTLKMLNILWSVVLRDLVNEVTQVDVGVNIRLGTKVTIGIDAKKSAPASSEDLILKPSLTVKSGSWFISVAQSTEKTSRGSTASMEAVAGFSLNSNVEIQAMQNPHFRETGLTNYVGTVNFIF